MPSLHGLTPLARALLIRHSVRKTRLLATTGLALALPVMAAQAQEVKLNIPAQPLAAALTEFGRQADVQVLYSPDIVAGQNSAAVNGSFSIEQGISQLLRGTKVRFSLQDNLLTL
ncbi:MAG: STN domain-containing protein, partial [Pseudomonas putida]